MKLLVALVFLVALTYVKADNWAVLVAGSDGYENYRHQADICHAYQIMIKNGIPADHIIVMAYDDIAESRKNPFKGKVFNKPTAAGTAGYDVYDGCKIDYKEKDVTPKNFMAILKGDASAVEGGNGKVLKSTKDDKVFINFADHGGYGLIAFPKGLIRSHTLHADDFIETLQYMHDHNMYSQLVFYLEACESGSMFENLPTNISIYATSASNKQESSWGTYCPPQDKVNGKSLGSCLGDLYSVNWMEDSDLGHVKTETLEQQYQKVKKETVKSHVMEFGDMSWNTEPIGDFQGENPSGSQTRARRTKNVHFGVDSRDIKLHYLMNQYSLNPTEENLREMREEEQSREYFDSTFTQLAKVFGAKTDEQVEGMFTATPPLKDQSCQKASIRVYEEHCQQLSDYSLKYARFLQTICELTQDQELVLQAIKDVCYQDGVIPK